MLGPLSEIILYVADMDAQVRFYRDTLGLQVEYPAGLADYGDEYWVVLATGECKLALHGGGQKQFGEDAPKFVFTVKDAKGVRTELHDRGVSVGEVRSPAEGIAVVDCQDPEGNRFSLESRAGASE